METTHNSGLVIRTNSGSRKFSEMDNCSNGKVLPMKKLLELFPDFRLRIETLIPSSFNWIWLRSLVCILILITLVDGYQSGGEVLVNAAHLLASEVTVLYTQPNLKLSSTVRLLKQKEWVGRGRLGYVGLSPRVLHNILWTAHFETIPTRVTISLLMEYLLQSLTSLSEMFFQLQFSHVRLLCSIR